MLITSIKIRRLKKSETKLQGIASVVLDNMIAIHDIKLLRKNDSMFLAMPSRMTKANTFKDIVHPINGEVRQKLEQLIVAAYKETDAAEYNIAEFLLCEDRGELHFEDLSFNDYRVNAKVSTEADYEKDDNDFIGNMQPVRQKIQPKDGSDEKFLLWLEGGK